MKSCILTLLVAFAAITTLNAQITIDQADFPQAGNSVTIHYADGGTGVGDSVDVGAAGANGTYDFTKIVPFIEESFEQHFIDASATPFIANHPGTDVAMLDNVEIDSTSQDTILKLYFFHTSSANAFVRTGVTAVIDTAAQFNMQPPSNYDTFHVQYDVSDTLVSTDYTFGHTEQEYSAYIADIGPVQIKQLVYRTVEVDGWGTLAAPNGTYDVLRIKSMEIRIDTTFFNGFVADNGTDTSYIYDYFAKGIGTSIVSLEMDPSYTEVYGLSYAGDTMSVGINEVAFNTREVELYPNPAQQFVVVKVEAQGSPVQSITVFNLLGQEQIRKETALKAYQNELDVTSLSKGTYFVRVAGEGWQTVRKLVIGKN